MSFGGGFGGFGSNNNTGNTASTGFGGFGGATSGGFGSNTNTGGGFGSTNTGGGGLFGGGGASGANTASTGGAFGGATGAFGANNTANSFGAAKPAFGAAPSTGGGLFGGSAATTGGFGGGGFGSNTGASTSSPFGGGTSGGGGLFGGGGAAKPAFGTGASTGTTGGLFGGGAANTTSGGFGSTGAFGAPASTALAGPVGDPPGTATTPFQPLVEKEGTTGNAQNSFQNILFQEPYKKWSAEELRLADYAQGRRFGNGAGGGFGGGGFGAATGGFGSNNATTSSFGAGSNTGGGLFGGANNASGGFGTQNNTTGGFGAAAGGGLFGQKPAAPAGGGLFGSGATTQPAQSGTGLFGSGGGGFGSGTNTTGGFGAANTNTGGLFGNNNAAAGQQKTGSGFSFGNATNNTSTGFGTNTANTGGGFGGGATGGGGLFGAGNAQQNNTGGTGGLFGNANQQQNTNTPFGGAGAGGFGAQNNQQQGGGLFGNNQQKPAGGGLFGSAAPANTNTGGGLFGGANTQQSTGFGGATQQQSGGLFGGAKPATGGLFGGTQPAQNNTGGGLFGGLGGQQQPQQQQQQQPQQGGGLFGGMNQSQNKPSLFGASTQPAATGGGLFGSSQNQQQGGLFGGSQNQQQPQNTLGGSFFGGSTNSQGPPALTASINDPSAYGVSLFGNLPVQTSDPGPLATPLSAKKQTKRPSILPIYKLNPGSASRFATPQKRGFGFSYSSYGTPNSPSSATNTPASMSQSLIAGGSLNRSMSKSVSTNTLRRSFNVEDSLLAPGAFSASTSSRLYGNNNVKKLVINRDLRNDLFSTPTRDQSSQDAAGGSRKVQKRVSFETSNGDAAGEASDAQNDTQDITPSATDLGYIRPKRSNGVNGPKTATPETEHTSGNELAIVHEEDVPAASTPTPAEASSDKEPGAYWMSPTKEEISSMNRVQRQKVSNFTVGRDNCGWVKFKVPVDLTTIDLDNLYENIVVLEIRSCTVYPNQAKKPPVGKGLNVPSLINLENSWPRAAKGGKSRKGGPSLTKHIERLKRIEGTKFENYNQETGEWTFSVEHFTTYGLDYDEDEETEVDPTAATPRAVAPPSEDSMSLSPADDLAENDTFDFRHRARAFPGAFDAQPAFDDEEEVAEMEEVRGARSSFLGDRSAGSKSKALVSVEQEDLDDEYAMSEDEQDASALLGHHLAAEHDDDSFNGSQPDVMPETPAGIMRARMRAIKESATPTKVQVAAGDDWMDMLRKTISPQKRDRAFLKSQREADYGRDGANDQSPAKKRVVADDKGFATSIDLMKSLFDQAKAPTEKVQPSVRPQSVKWPYQRMPKTLGESEMNDLDRQWHNTPRPTWGPSGTLVFAATPTETPFGRSGRITEKNGLMTVMKGAIITESQDIRIAKFTNEMAAKALRTQIELTEVYLDEGVPTVMGPRVSMKEFATEGSIKSPAGEHEKLVWELGSVLFDTLKSPAEVLTDPEAARRVRRENLSKFWERMLEDDTNKGISLARSGEEKALAALAGHRVAEACKHLMDSRNFRLATLVALIGNSDAVKKDMREQIREWQEANVLSEFSGPVRALYEMLSGNVCACEGRKGGPVENRMDSFVISRKFGLNWKQAFGLRLWYAASVEDGIVDAVEKYRDDVTQDKEMPPITWFAEHGIHGIWNDQDADQRQDLLWGLLQLYSDDEADLESIIRPENSQLSPLDYRLCWQLGQALTATGKITFGSRAEEKADAVTVSFAAQLTNEGSWLEAAFVLLHLSDPDARTKAIQEHLSRHAGQIGDEHSESFRYLTDKLKMPVRWIWHAKALYMRSVKEDAASEVQCLLRAESFTEAHRTFIKEVAPVAIIEREYQALSTLLRQFDGRQSQVAEWNLGGEIYKAFLQLVDYEHRHEHPPPALVSGLLEGLPAMHGNTPEASILEYAALTDMAAVVASVVGDLARLGQMNHERILQLPLTEDVLLKHSRNLAWAHYQTVLAGH